MKWETQEVRLPDTFGVSISPWGAGNLKLGPHVVSYSRLPVETCPGATPECLRVCYARKVSGPVRDVWALNGGSWVPPIPKDVKLLRLHVSGDFDTRAYAEYWEMRLQDRPDVKAWVYTRSWRVPGLLSTLERIRALPNVQMFASMDPSSEPPPPGWRVAWMDEGEGPRVRRAPSGAMSYVCPEETGHRRDCESCRYCFDGRKGDVTFLKH